MVLRVMALAPPHADGSKGRRRLWPGPMPRPIMGWQTPTWQTPAGGVGPQAPQNKMPP